MLTGVTTLILAVHRVNQVERLPLPDGWTIWETDTDIGQTYKGLAIHAVEAGWGHELVVVQDDVRFTRDPSGMTTTGLSVIAYGQRKRPGHVCPRAFSADRRGWAMLKRVWLPAPNTLCPGFTRVVDQVGITLDWTEHHG